MCVCLTAHGFDPNPWLMLLLGSIPTLGAESNYCRLQPVLTFLPIFARKIHASGLLEFTISNLLRVSEVFSKTWNTCRARLGLWDSSDESKIFERCRKHSSNACFHVSRGRCFALKTFFALQRRTGMNKWCPGYVRPPRVQIAASSLSCLTARAQWSRGQCYQQHLCVSCCDRSKAYCPAARHWNRRTKHKRVTRSSLFKRLVSQMDISLSSD